MLNTSDRFPRPSKEFTCWEDGLDAGGLWREGEEGAGLAKLRVGMFSGGSSEEPWHVWKYKYSF